MREAFRRPIGERHARLANRSPSRSPCPNLLVQIFLSKCSWKFGFLYPSITLPEVALSASAAHLGPSLGLLARLLVENFTFQEAFKKTIIFWLRFGIVFLRFLIDFPSQLGSQNQQKIDKNQSQDAFPIGTLSLLIFHGFLNIFLKNRLLKLTSIFDSILVSTWGHFGSKIVQNPSKNRS